eukprot:4481665-Pleurochrysis_carterae.AAC.2
MSAYQGRYARVRELAWVFECLSRGGKIVGVGTHARTRDCTLLTVTRKVSHITCNRQCCW